MRLLAFGIRTRVAACVKEGKESSTFVDSGGQGGSVNHHESGDIKINASVLQRYV